VSGQATDGDVVGAGRMAEHINGVTGRAKVRAVHGADHACPDDEYFHDKPPIVKRC